MADVRFSSEGIRSLGKLPSLVLTQFDLAFSEIAKLGPSAPSLDTHQLSVGKGLSTLRIGVYRGVFGWDGSEAPFIRFGHRRSVYSNLPK